MQDPNKLFWIAGELPNEGLEVDQIMTHLNTWPALLREQDISALSDHYTNEILKLQPRGPYFIGGFCFSGVIAYEVARRLTHCGQEVRLLAMVLPWRPGSESPSFRFARRLIFSIYNPHTIIDFLLDYFYQIGFKRTNGHANSDAESIDPWSILEKDTESIDPWSILEKKVFGNYVAQPYKGRVTLIIGDKMPQRFLLHSLWDKVAEGGIDIEIVKATNWKELLHTNVVPEKLIECIDKAMISRYPNVNHSKNWLCRKIFRN